MTDNILKKQILCTCGEYLAEVYGARTKPFRDAVLHVFDAIVTGSSTLVSDLSRTLRRDASCEEAKRTQELVSRWLERYDFTSAANPHLLGGAKGATDATTFAVDFSDVSKEFGGAGMEGMAMGWDGSRGVAAMGHDFVCVSLVGAAHPEAQPVYTRIAQGWKSKRELIRDALDAVAGAARADSHVSDRAVAHATKLSDLLRWKSERAVSRTNFIACSTSAKRISWSENRFSSSFSSMLSVARRINCAFKTPLAHHLNKTPCGDLTRYPTERIMSRS